MQLVVLGRTRTSTRTSGRPESPAIAHYGLWLVLITFGALVLRVFIVMHSRQQPVGGDGFTYSIQANQIAQGKLFVSAYNGQPDAFHPPAWVVVLSALAVLGGHSWLSQQLLSCCIGAATVAIIGLAGRRIAGDRAGLVAAGIAAVYAGLWVYERALLSETLLMLVIAVMVLGAYRFRKHPSARMAAGLGAVAGLLALTRSEQILIWPFLVAPMMLAVKHVRWRRRIALLVLATGSMLIVIIPWTVFNLGRFQHVVVLSTGFGGAVAAANCSPAYYGLYTGYYGNLSCLPHVHSSDQTVIDAVDRHAAKVYAEHHLSRLPMVLVAREGRAFAFWAPFQQTALDSSWQDTKLWVTRLGLFSYWGLVAAAVPGAIILRSRRVPLFPLLAFVASVALTVAVTYGETRYRASAEISVVLLAAVAIDAWLPSSRRALADSYRIASPRDHESHICTDQGEPVTESTPPVKASLFHEAGGSLPWRRLAMAVVVAALATVLVVIGVGSVSWNKAPTSPPGVKVLVPTNGAVLKASQPLAATASESFHITRVEFYLTGGSLNKVRVATGRLGLYGWVASWNTTQLANGTYALTSVAYGSAGRAVQSPAISVSVRD